MIKAGIYKARARRDTLSFTHDKSGAGRCKMTFALIGEGVEGQSVTWFSSLKGGAAEVTCNQLRAAGWTGDTFRDTSGIGETDAEIEVKYRAGADGREQMDVQVRRKFEFDNPLEGKDLDALSAQLAGVIAKSKGGRRPATRAPATNWDGTGADPDDTDPFREEAF